MPVGRDRKLRTALKTNQIPGFVTVHRMKNRYCYLLYCKIPLFFSPDGFSEEGCYVDHSKSNSEQTVCSCNHLTHFAVLVDFSGNTKVALLLCETLLVKLFNVYINVIAGTA